MRTSLGIRLLASLAATVLAAWVVTAVFSYRDARQRIGEMLDDHLVQAASLILQASGGEQVVRAPVHWGSHEEGHSLRYQGWSAAGQLLFRSHDAPERPLSAQAEGFSLVERDGRRWRVFGLRGPEGSLIQVAEHADFRDELAASVARHLLYPLIVALPVLAALIWLSVRWGLRPLRALAADVRRREPGNLTPLDPSGAPGEARPLVEALDTLFQRVAASIESERRFTADAAHELRTPLAAIQTHAEVALGANDASDRAAALAHVTEGITRANRLVGQLLLLARLDARGPALPAMAVDLARVATRQVADAAPFAARRGINLGLNAPAEAAGPVEVRGDEDLLSVLVRNLVDNAIRYTPRGGRVDVSVQPEHGRVLLTVADSGPGVPAAERAAILQRFHRGSGSGEEGSGLGLSIVARIAELHGATLALDDGPGGRGLSVTVALRG